MDYSSFKILIEMTKTHTQTHRALSNISKDDNVLLMLFKNTAGSVFMTLCTLDQCFQTAGCQPLVTLKINNMAI
jgi:hypothetical protein